MLLALVHTREKHPRRFLSVVLSLHIRDSMTREDSRDRFHVRTDARSPHVAPDLSYKSFTALDERLFGEVAESCGESGGNGARVGKDRDERTFASATSHTSRFSM